VAFIDQGSQMEMGMIVRIAQGACCCFVLYPAMFNTSRRSIIATGTVKNLNNWTVCHRVFLSQEILGFYLSRKGKRGCVFAVFFALSREGNFGWHTV